VLPRLLFALLFLLAFVVLPFGVSQFETGKVLVGEGLVFAILFFFLQDRIFRKQKLPLSVTIVFFTIIILSLVHILRFDPHQILFGNAYRLQGVFLLWLLLIFTYISSYVRLPRIQNWMIVLILVPQFLAAMFLTVTVDGRAVGTVGEPNSLAGYVVFLWPFLFLLNNSDELQEEERKKYVKRKKQFHDVWTGTNRILAFRISGTMLSLLIIIFSGSRSGLIAFGIEAVFLVAISFFRLSIVKAFLIAFCLLLITLSFPFFETGKVYENRGEIWQTAVYAGYEHPVIGWGFGNTETAFKEYNTKLYNRLRGYYIDSSHNIFLDWWIQGGFIGLASLVLLVLGAIRVYVRNRNQLFLCLLLGILTILSFNPVSIVILLQFWWLIGCSLIGEENLN
jgi:O-antigen ligase